MKRILLLFMIVAILLSGCSLSNTEEIETESSSVQKEEALPSVENIPNCPWWEQRKFQEEVNFMGNVTKDGIYTYLYGCTESGKQEYLLAELTEQDEWEMSPVAWETELRKRTKEVLTDVAVCSDGSYIGVVQPEDDLPVFYQLKEDGEVTEWKLPDGILKWDKDAKEKVRWILVNEKNQVVISTYFSGHDYIDGEPVSATEPSHTIVYDPFKQEMISEREYVGSKDEVVVAGDYMFSSVPTGEYMGIRVYRMDGGGAQAVMSHDTITSAKDHGFTRQRFVCYRGGDYGYWYTDFGIYRFPVKKSYNGSEELELVIPSECYVRQDENYNVLDMVCSEGDSEMEFYVEIITHILNDNGTSSPGDVILTRYAE